MHTPEACYLNDEEDKQFEGVPEYFRSWPESDVAGWPDNQPGELGRDVNDGGCWTGGGFSSLLLEAGLVY